MQVIDDTIKSLPMYWQLEIMNHGLRVAMLSMNEYEAAEIRMDVASYAWIFKCQINDAAKQAESQQMMDDFQASQHAEACAEWFGISG